MRGEIEGCGERRWGEGKEGGLWGIRRGMGRKIDCGRRRRDVGRQRGSGSGGTKAHLDGGGAEIASHLRFIVK